GRGDGGDEELRAVGVPARVGHRQQAGPGVLDLEVLVVELPSPDALAAGAVPRGEVAALQHEGRDDPVERRALVAVPVLTGGQLPEVLGRVGDDVVVELEDDAPGGGVVDGDVEEDVACHGVIIALIGHPFFSPAATARRCDRGRAAPAPGRGAPPAGAPEGGGSGSAMCSPSGVRNGGDRTGSPAARARAGSPVTAGGARALRRPRGAGVTALGGRPRTVAVRRRPGRRPGRRAAAGEEGRRKRPPAGSGQAPPSGAESLMSV